MEHKIRDWFSAIRREYFTPWTNWLIGAMILFVAFEGFTAVFWRPAAVDSLLPLSKHISGQAWPWILALLLLISLVASLDSSVTRIRRKDSENETLKKRVAKLEEWRGTDSDRYDELNGRLKRTEDKLNKAEEERDRLREDARRRR